jgi:hypothetical protein
MREHFQINMHFALFANLFVLHITGVEILFGQNSDLAQKFQGSPERMFLPLWEFFHA